LIIPKNFPDNNPNCQSFSGIYAATLFPIFLHYVRDSSRKKSLSQSWEMDGPKNSKNFVFLSSTEGGLRMLQIFGGMIIGSIMTMMLLGGASAADQILANTQTLFLDQINRPDTTTTLLLLIVLSIFLASLTAWPTKPVMDTKQVIKNLRRHCS
jgi:hypothetical protein